MKLNYPSVNCLEKEILFEDGKYCILPKEYKRTGNQKLISDFYNQQLKKHKGSSAVQIGTDPLGFDFAILDYMCYVGLIFIGERSSIKNSNKKKYPKNKFSADYIESRLLEEYDLKNINKFVPIEIFSQSLHELRGLNSKISGHVDNLMNLTDEENWVERFDQSEESLKKIYVSSRLTKFILDNTRFYDPDYIASLSIDTQFKFAIHRSVYKIVKIYQNDFVADKTEINLEGKTYRSILGEREFFEILIKTLVENAIKFTTDKRINPKIEIKELPDLSVVIKVSSYGRLIPSEERKDIFSRSYRSSVHRSVKGTGMGLFIASSIAKLYGIVISYNAIEASEDKDIKIGWNEFILKCTRTIK